jgi:deazaflavin-dependent oxidoreductase (nitroreductase family)
MSGKVCGIDRRRFNSALAKYGVNPVVRAMFALRLPVPGTAILETTGRRSGEPRRTPVTNGLDGDTFWIVAEHGERAAYVRNLRADPRVRVRIGRRWRTGTAEPLPADDWRARQRQPYLKKMNSAVVRAMKTTPMTVRVDLDPER